MQQPSPGTPTTRLDFEQAISLFGEGRYAEAEVLCRRALETEPGEPHALHMLALIRADAGAAAEALTLLQQALATGVQHPAIHLAHGRLLLHFGRGAEAVTALQQSLRIDPQQPKAVALLAKTLTSLGRAHEARGLLDAALKVLPEDAALRDASGVAYMAQGRYSDAASELERALAIEPGLADAQGSLALVYEQTNRIEDAQRVLESGLVRSPQQPTLRLIAARLTRRAGDPAGARAAASAFRDEAGLAAALVRDLEFELGWCADALGETDTAMAHFRAAKDQALAIAAPAAGLSQIFPRQLASLKRFYSQAALPTAGVPQRPMPVFLCGFPRSGTTLLDTMLSAHPGLAVMEEQAGIQAMLDGYTVAGLNYADDLARLSPELCAELRAAHTRVCRAAGWDGVKGLIDKSPFATAHLGLIQQVFPMAPVVFMARHPCDVVLSCFMNSFEINSGTVHFTKLDSAVALYCGVLELWQLYLRRLPLRHIVIRYEDLTAHPEVEMRRLLDFLGLPWTATVLEHERSARERGRIPTPSYHQVSKPLYQDARGRWRRYARHLEPYLPQLEPHIRAFSYDT